MVVVRPKVTYHQEHLANTIHEIFCNENIKVNTRKETNIKGQYGRSIEWDIWIPDLNISFEYQDDYHYITKWYAHRTLAFVTQRDSFKLAKTRLQGITLIVIPCWWDGTKESLIATISFHRPDLIEFDDDMLDSIPENPPENYFEVEEVPDIGELMLAAFPTNRTQYNSIASDTVSWWMGEKYDGVRCCWNPKTPALYTRSGTLLEIPSSLIALFPKAFLDGEIWFGRGFLSEAQKVIYGDISESVDLNYFRIVAFDHPSPFPSLNSLPFEYRYSSLFMFIQNEHAFINIATRTLCTKFERLSTTLANLLEEGSEGIILRKPGSEYVHGRSPFLFKLKATRADREALVVSCKSNSYVLKLPEGLIFDVPSENNASNAAPRPGDVVTISYDSYTRNAVPMSPIISQIRKDVNWEQILRDYVRYGGHELENMQGEFEDPMPNKPYNYWVAEKGKNMRKFMEDFAKNLNFDPLIAENWYKIVASQYKELARILSHFKGSYATALTELFPEVKFERAKFIILPRNHWQHMNSRREFFDQYASHHAFDPLIAENWYGVDTGDVLNFKNGRGALGAYNMSLVNALMHVYPNIGLQKSKFYVGDTLWEDENERRKFFIDLAAKYKFDPLVAANWYSVTAEQIRREKNGGQLLMKHKGNLGKALMDLFPEVPFDRTQFKSLLVTFWSGTGNFRSYFLRFAKANKFDPLLAENWYSITTHIVKAFRDTSESARKNRVSLTSFFPLLIQSFPDLDLRQDKFRYISAAKFWADIDNRRSVFIDFARSRGMDPFMADTWYSFRIKEIEQSKKIRTILQYHKGIVPALLDLFPDIGIDARKFHKYAPYKYWSDMRNRKMYLTQFARDNLFDPLIPENWYKCNLDKLWDYKGSHHLLRCYSGNFVRAIMSVFPDIGLQKTGFMVARASKKRASTYTVN